MVENAFKWELWRMRGKVWVRSLWVLVVGKAQVGVIGHKWGERSLEDTIHACRSRPHTRIRSSTNDTNI